MFTTLIHKLEANGWKIVEYEEAIKEEVIIQTLKRYHFVDAHYLQWLCKIQSCVSKDESMFFLCYQDYRDESTYAFKWNEFEQLSLAAAEGDLMWIDDIIHFWDHHLPIVLSVGGDYKYYGIRYDGCIISGSEPEFEETEVIADSFLDFIEGMGNRY